MVVVVVWLLSHLQLLQPHGLLSATLLCQWDSPGKNTRAGCHFPLQVIFPTQESNAGLLHCRQLLYQLLGGYLSYFSIAKFMEENLKTRLPL